MANEKRLIDANGSYTLNATDNTGHSLCFGGGIISVMDNQGGCICEFFADDAPTVDAVEVVHGRWERTDYPEFCKGDFECSVCEHLECDIDTSILMPGVNCLYYCPNCGAKMDGERRGK